MNKRKIKLVLNQGNSYAAASPGETIEVDESVAIALVRDGIAKYEKSQPIKKSIKSSIENTMKAVEKNKNKDYPIDDIQI